MNNNKNAKEANWALRDAASEWYHGPYNIISSNKGKSSTGIRYDCGTAWQPDRNYKQVVKAMETNWMMNSVEHSRYM